MKIKPIWIRAIFLNMVIITLGIFLALGVTAVITEQLPEPPTEPQFPELPTEPQITPDYPPYTEQQCKNLGGECIDRTCQLPNSYSSGCKDVKNAICCFPMEKMIEILENQKGEPVIDSPSPIPINTKEECFPECYTKTQVAEGKIGCVEGGKVKVDDYLIITGSKESVWNVEGLTKEEKECPYQKDQVFKNTELNTEYIPREGYMGNLLQRQPLTGCDWESCEFCDDKSFKTIEDCEKSITFKEKLKGGWNNFILKTAGKTRMHWLLILYAGELNI